MRTDIEQICPYTGLRSFTEEESLYFKGRDTQVDQITALAEQNKFLMVTGASGDGKSSLVFAGLIPNARAGFFKSKYSNWLIADFRPERDPVRNMAIAVAAQLGMHPDTVETELRRGYSSLVDLYTGSDHYADENDPSFRNLSEAEQKTKKRKSANLMILLDQFEEFFTNPENFRHEAPSTDAQIVVNLILETSRIALKRDLPIYSICTMRSDYIGQCSAFRGLPEYIGFSQFFVPRLKRRDLKQVIEEPAILSGNRITQRLIERLVYDVADGVDQLPILQHALSRIWQAAGNGSEEMDLLHYAMVGGMSEDDLPDDDRERFQTWFKQIPENEQKFYKETGLARIIDIHANLLYENAWARHNERYPEKPVSQKEAKRVVAITFSCLTKIDNSRAVRNRMSLSEITAIINEPGFDATRVGRILELFREEGNSFIRPFLPAEGTHPPLHPDTVLDITHESLIRNWEKLKTWADKEFEYYSTWLDLEKQLGRWKSSGKSRGFLLPIGPLNYFESWYKNARPNPGWLERYNPRTEAIANASSVPSETMLADIREFLRKSAAKEWVTRAFMKYGARRIATFLAIATMVGLTLYYWYDADRKKNPNVIERVRTEAASLIASKDVDDEEKALYLMTEERYEPGSLFAGLNKSPFTAQLSLAVEVYRQMLHIDKQHETPLRKQVLALIEKDLTQPEEAVEPDLLLSQGNKFVTLLAMDQYYNPDSLKFSMLTRMTRTNRDLVLHFLRDGKLYRPTIPTQLNLAIQFWLTFGKAAPGSIRELLGAFTPGSGANADSAFHTYFPAGSFEPDGSFNHDFNGGYHTLACLYATLGDTAKVNSIFQGMLDGNQRGYFEMARVLNNHLNVIGFLYQYGHRDQVPGVMDWIGTHTTDNPRVTLLRNVVLRSGYISHLYDLNFYVTGDVIRATSGYIHPNLYFCPREQFDTTVRDHEALLRQEKDPAKRNFQLAMSAKRKALFYSKYWFDRKLPVDSQKLDKWLGEAITLYKQTDSSFLEGTEFLTMIYNGDGVRAADVKRRDIFLYPDYRDGWFANNYHSDYYVDYLLRTGQVNNLYHSAADLHNLHYWMARAFEWKPEISPLVYGNLYSPSDHTLESLLAVAKAHPAGAGFDRNLPTLVLAVRNYERGDSIKGLAYARQLDHDRMPQSLHAYEYVEKNFLLNMINRLSIFLYRSGHEADAGSLMALLEDDSQRALSSFLISEDLYRNKSWTAAFPMLDSGFRYASALPYSTGDFSLDPRFAQIRLLSEIGGRELGTKSVDLLRSMPENFKLQGIISRVAGIAYEGTYHKALMAVPNNLTESQDLWCHTLILLEAARARAKERPRESWEFMDTYIFWNWYYHNYTGI
jgi:hypothetical protein